MDFNTSTYGEIQARLHRFRQKAKLLNLLRGSIVFLAIVLGLALISIGIELLRLPITGRMILVSLWAVTALVSLVAWVLRPLINLLFFPSQPDDIEIALRIGRHYPDVADRLANALEIQNQDHARSENYSRELIQAALYRIIASIKDRDFTQILDRQPLRKALRRFGFGLCVGIGLLSAFLNPFGQSYFRLTHPLTAFETGPTVQVFVTPGNVAILKGENVHIAAWISGKPAQNITLEWQRVPGGEPDTKMLTKANTDTFRYTFESVKDSLSYRVRFEKWSSPRYTVSVNELPMLRNLQLKLVYPAYTRLGSQMLDENVGDVTAIKGTQVQVSAVANKPVSVAELIFDHEKRQPLTSRGVQLNGQFRVTTDATFTIYLKDASGRENDTPIEYRITALPDRSPVVSIPVPGADVDIGEDMILPMRILAEDDYGFSKLRLGIKLLRAGSASLDSTADYQYTDLVLEKPNEPLLQKQFRWDLNSLSLLPEDVVLYFAEVFDNDFVSGPKSARSNVYQIRFPSIYEIYQEVAQTHEEAYEGLQDVYQQTKQLHERFEDILQEMKKNDDLKWEERKEMEDAVDTQKLMQEQLENINQNLEKMIEQMERNDLVTAKTMEKYQELQELFKEIASPELEQAMKQLNEALQKLDPELVKQAAENLQFSQEDMLKSIERTISLLKQLQIEQMLDEAIRKADDLAERQEKINQMNKDGKESPQNLAQLEQRVADDTQELQEHLQNLQEKLAEIPELPPEGVQKAESFMDSTQMAEQMQALSQQLSAQNQKQAQQMGNQAAQDLQQLSQMLQDAKSQMGMGMQQQMMQAMRKTTFDLLELSKRQEQLMGSTQQMDRNSPQMSGMAEQQQDMASGLGRVLSEIDNLSQKSMALTPQIGSALGQGMDQMNQAQDELEARNPTSASRSQGQAMTAMNNAVQQMQNLMNMMNQMSGSGGMGMQQFIQQLQQMAQQQQGINQQTMGMGMGGSQLTMAQQAAMQRLAAQQQNLAKSLEQMYREMEGKSQILGDLGKVADDMEDVAKDLQQKNVNPRTIERQERILSRLLDAQRSVRRRDYSRKREAETGKQYYAINPGALPGDLGERKNTLQEDILRAEKEGYARDYLELIRQYFEALQKEKMSK